MVIHVHYKHVNDLMATVYCFTWSWIRFMYMYKYIFKYTIGLYRFIRWIWFWDGELGGSICLDPGIWLATAPANHQCQHSCDPPEHKSLFQHWTVQTVAWLEDSWQEIWRPQMNTQLSLPLAKPKSPRSRQTHHWPHGANNRKNIGQVDTLNRCWWLKGRRGIRSRLFSLNAEWKILMGNPLVNNFRNNQLTYMYYTCSQAICGIEWVNINKF